MKRIWISVILLTCLLGLLGCTAETPGDAAATDSGVWLSVENETFPEAPPDLHVICGGESITAWRGTYSWHVLLDDGMGRGKHADSIHPLSALDRVPVIAAADGAEVMLTFEIPTEVQLQFSSLEVRRYRTDAEDYDDYEAVTVEEDTFVLTAEDALYEVIASWDVSDGAYSGDARYAFRTEGK